MSEFEKEAERVLGGMPEFFKSKMENVVITVREKPEPGVIEKFGKGILGLYEGVPISERGTAYSGAMPDKITLYKENIEKSCREKGEIPAKIRDVLVHEIAHHFGISDEELLRKGIY